MTKQEIANYYSRLSNDENGRFTTFLSVAIGGSLHTGQQKILGWTHNIVGRPMSPIIEKELSAIIEQDKWGLRQ